LDAVVTYIENAVHVGDEIFLSDGTLADVVDVDLWRGNVGWIIGDDSCPTYPCNSAVFYFYNVRSELEIEWYINYQPK